MGMPTPVAMMRTQGGVLPTITNPTLKAALGGTTSVINLPGFGVDANAEIWLYNPQRHTSSPVADVITSSPSLTWEGPYAVSTNDATAAKLRSSWWRAKAGASAIPDLAITLTSTGGRHAGVALQIASGMTGDAPTNMGTGSADSGGDVSGTLTIPPVATSVVLLGAVGAGANQFTESANCTPLFAADVSGSAVPVLVAFDEPPASDTAGGTSANTGAAVCSLVEVKSG